MPVNITQDEMDIFSKNGISEDNIKATVNNYRADGLNDDEIRAKFDKKLYSFKTPNSPKTNNFLTGAVDVAKSLPTTAKELGVGMYRSFPQFGKGVNDLVALTGDVTGIKVLSYF